MLVILDAGGLQGGGTNFDAKIRRNSTDLEDLFIAHIAAMDAFARSLTIAHNILEKSPYLKIRKERYASFDKGNGKAFEQGKFTLEDLAKMALKNGEPMMTSGKQELYEALINMYILFYGHERSQCSLYIQYYTCCNTGRIAIRI